MTDPQVSAPKEWLGRCAADEAGERFPMTETDWNV